VAAIVYYILVTIAKAVIGGRKADTVIFASTYLMMAQRGADGSAAPVLSGAEGLTACFPVCHRGRL